MQQSNHSTDLYTISKYDEQLPRYRISQTSLFNPIPFKSNTSKFLVPTFGQVFYTDGHSPMKQDSYCQRTLFDEEMEIPSIGTDQKNFDTAEMITFDISGASTHLPLMCKMIIYQQGATHEREPPILVRDVCIQWDGIDCSNRNSIDCLSLDKTENSLLRARNSDHLLDNSIRSVNGRDLNDVDQRLSIEPLIIDDDEISSIMTTGGMMQRRVSHLLHRHKYLRQIDINLLRCSEFYSVPFYQYRGRRYGQKNVETQLNESELNNCFNHNNSKTYSVTVILPVRNRNEIMNTCLNISKVCQVSIPINNKAQHTTIGYINTKQFITIKRTIRGHVVDI